MAQKPAGPYPSTALAAALRTLGDEVERCGDRIDRDALALLRVTAACVQHTGSRSARHG